MNKITNSSDNIKLNTAINANDKIKKPVENMDESNTIKDSAKKYDRIEINKIVSDNEKRVSDFKELIKKMVAKQGEKSNLKLFGLDLNVSVEESEKAAKSIADGGEYSVDAVATRIMDMAVALANGDDSKISLLRNAVKKGFEAAGIEFDSEKGLPDICKNTYDEVMKRFDKWENKGSDL